MLLPNDSEQVCKGFHRQTPGLEPCQTFGDHKNWPIKQKLRLAEWSYNKTKLNKTLRTSDVINLESIFIDSGKSTRVTTQCLYMYIWWEWRWWIQSVQHWERCLLHKRLNLNEARLPVLLGPHASDGCWDQQICDLCLPAQITFVAPQHNLANNYYIIINILKKKRVENISQKTALAMHTIALGLFLMLATTQVICVQFWGLWHTALSTNSLVLGTSVRIRANTLTQKLKLQRWKSNWQHFTMLYIMWKASQLEQSFNKFDDKDSIQESILWNWMTP